MSTGLPDPDRTSPRRFWLVPHHDVSGVSGTGIVAEGILWSSGQVALHWPGQPQCTSTWASLQDLLAVHGHGGWTTVEWIDKGNDWHSEHIECIEYGDGGCVEVYDGAIHIH
jgi:hypothetical protein